MEMGDQKEAYDVVGFNKQKQYRVVHHYEAVK
jgi:hypothetical protein